MAQPFQSDVEKSIGQIENVDSDQMIPVFSLMCPGISLSTLSHDIRLLNILKFKDICNRVAVTIEFDPKSTDVAVVDNKLVQRTKFKKVVWNKEKERLEQVQRKNKNEYSQEHGYSHIQTYHPSFDQTTDLVGDTDMLSSFLESYKITDVFWISSIQNTYLREDFAVRPFKCREYRTNQGYQCVPAHQHVPWYIFTRYPPPETGLEM